MNVSYAEKNMIKNNSFTVVITFIIEKKMVIGKPRKQISPSVSTGTVTPVNGSTIFASMCGKH
jgi:hypothetical protein